jgi:hypothetical protein
MQTLCSIIDQFIVVVTKTDSTNLYLIGIWHFLQLLFNVTTGFLESSQYVLGFKLKFIGNLLVCFF